MPAYSKEVSSLERKAKESEDTSNRIIAKAERSAISTESANARSPSAQINVATPAASVSSLILFYWLIYKLIIIMYF